MFVKSHAIQPIGCHMSTIKRFIYLSIYLINNFGESIRVERIRARTSD